MEDFGSFITFPEKKIFMTMPPCLNLLGGKHQTLDPDKTNNWCKNILNGHFKK